MTNKDALAHVLEVFGEASTCKEDTSDSKRIECNVKGVKNCPKCYSPEINYTAIFNEPKMLIIRAVCQECGYSYSLPHIENLQKRTNSTLAKWREHVLKRDSYKCRICGDTEDLQAHHIIPVSNDAKSEYKYNINNGITLCKKHHKMVHPWMKERGEG